VNAFELLLRPPRIVERRADRLLPVVERLEQRLPRELREECHEDQEDEDGPDVKPRIRLDQWVHDTLPI
jgi:hypothetical protein